MDLILIMIFLASSSVTGNTLHHHRKYFAVPIEDNDFAVTLRNPCRASSSSNKNQTVLGLDAQTRENVRSMVGNMKSRLEVVKEKMVSTFFKALQITASVRERPLRAKWATKAAPTMFTAAVREPTLLFVTERDFKTSFI